MKSFFGFDKREKLELDRVGASLASPSPKQYYYNKYDIGYALFRIAIVLCFAGAVLTSGGLMFGACLVIAGSAVVLTGLLCGIAAILLGRNPSNRKQTPSAGG